MSEKDYCHYHSLQSASWLCSGCNIFLGECCVLKPPASHQKEPDCPNCEKKLEYLGHQHTVKPFWHDLNRFFSFPLNTSTLGFLICISFLGVMIPLLEFLTWPLIILLSSLGLKYLYHILENASTGNLSPPSVSKAFSSGTGLGLFFQQIIIIFVAAIAIGLAIRTNSQFMAITSQILVTLAMPASIMILAKEGTIGSAVNPANLYNVITQIGLPYLILFVFMMTLSSGPQYVIPLLSDALNPAAVAPLVIFVTGYFYCVIFAMIGYCLFQFEHKLGFDSETTFNDESISDEAHSIGLAKSYAEIDIREGRFNKAAERLQKAANLHPSDRGLALHFHRALIATTLTSSTNANSSKFKMLQEHSVSLIEHLCSASYFKDASDVYLSTERAGVKITLDSPNNIEKLADALLHKGAGKETVKLLHNFHKLFPNYINLGNVYFIAAKAYSEVLHQDDSATKLLDYIITKHPNDKDCSDWQKYRDLVTSMKSSQHTST